MTMRTKQKLIRHEYRIQNCDGSVELVSGFRAGTSRLVLCVRKTDEGNWTIDHEPTGLGFGVRFTTRQRAFDAAYLIEQACKPKWFASSDSEKVARSVGDSKRQRQLRNWVRGLVEGSVIPFSEWLSGKHFQR